MLTNPPLKKQIPSSEPQNEAAKFYTVSEILFIRDDSAEEFCPPSICPVTGKDTTNEEIQQIGIAPKYRIPTHWAVMIECARLPLILLLIYASLLFSREWIVVYFTLALFVYTLVMWWLLKYAKTSVRLPLRVSASALAKFKRRRKMMLLLSIALFVVALISCLPIWGDDYWEGEYIILYDITIVLAILVYSRYNGYPYLLRRMPRMHGYYRLRKIHPDFLKQIPAA